jgi:hypothetical protein
MDNEVTLSLTLPPNVTLNLTLTLTISLALQTLILCLTLSMLSSDEKWFYGLVARTFTKACESLGVQKQSYSCQHKSHITKVMGHGTVGFCFDNDPEQDGQGYLIGLHRCQS